MKLKLKLLKLVEKPFFWYWAAMDFAVDNMTDDEVEEYCGVPK